VPLTAKHVNIGIVGLGKMGILHAGILNALPGCKLVAITEKEGLLVRFAKKLLPDMKFYSNVTKMLAKENLDVVYVTTPISTHLSIIEEIASTQDGIALFMEKPLAGTLEDAKEITNLSKEHRLNSMMGFQKRFSPIFQRAKQMLEARTLGEVKSFTAYSFVSGIFSEGRGWRFESGQGGALLDLGPHLFDLLIWYFGEPTYAEGSTRSIYSRDVDDRAHGNLRFESGIVGSFDVSWSVEGYRLPEIGIEVAAKYGTLRVTDDYLMIEVNPDAPNMKAGKYHYSKPEFNMGVDFLIGDPEFCAEDKYFVECVSNQEHPEPDFKAGLRVNNVIEKIRNSTSAERIK